MRQLAPWLVLLAAISFALGMAAGVADAQAEGGDRDGDGFLNADDACPHEFGKPKHDGCPTRYVVRSKVVRPKKHINRTRHFTPTCCPSSSEVGRIADLEQARWGGPSIRGRIYCESRNNYGATNGSYRGLLQIGSWWNYAWPRTPRDVTVKDEFWHKVWVKRVRRFNTGALQRFKTRKVRQHVHLKKEGKLPDGASPYHGWAAIRVGQRAVSGDGPSTAWSCGL